MGVVHAHGLRGELKLVLDHESSTLRWVGLSVLLEPRGGGASRMARVTSFRRAGAVGIVALEGIADRTAAEAVAGAILSVAREDLPEPAEDEVYLADLEGLDVEAEGRRVGRVERIEIYPSSSAAVVVVEGREVEIPIHEPYVVEVDLGARVLRVAHLEELLAPAAPEAATSEGE